MPVTEDEPVDAAPNGSEAEEETGNDASAETAPDTPAAANGESEGDVDSDTNEIAATTAAEENKSKRRGWWQKIVD